MVGCEWQWLAMFGSVGKGCPLLGSDTRCSPLVTSDVYLDLTNSYIFLCAHSFRLYCFFAN